jgi:hypothetical protein
MSGTSVKLDLLVAGTNSDELEMLTRDLRAELLQLDVDCVDLPRGDQPPTGTKAGDVLVIGSLVLAISNSNLVRGVAEVLKSWIGRSADRSVRLEIGGDALEATGLSAELRDRLIEEWLASHISSDK